MSEPLLLASYRDIIADLPPVMSLTKQELLIDKQIPIIPLGRAVEGMMAQLVKRGLLDERQVLWGFPHPSGANGHRHQQFSDHEQQMKRIVHRWF